MANHSLYPLSPRKPASLATTALPTERRASSAGHSSTLQQSDMHHENIPCGTRSHLFYQLDLPSLYLDTTPKARRRPRPLPTAPSASSAPPTATRTPLLTSTLYAQTLRTETKKRRPRQQAGQTAGIGKRARPVIPSNVINTANRARPAQAVPPSTLSSGRADPGPQLLRSPSAPHAACRAVLCCEYSSAPAGLRERQSA